jgi:hypothetical protein
MGDATLIGGGLMIMGNPCDKEYINNTDGFAEKVHEGFYDDAADLGEDFNIDDVADCAEADVDLAGDTNLANYAGDDVDMTDFDQGDLGDALDVDN